MQLPNWHAAPGDRDGLAPRNVLQQVAQVVPGLVNADDSHEHKSAEPAILQRGIGRPARRVGAEE
jgi:hypothetical protein